MDVEVGSNLYRNTDGTIEIEGVPQIQMTLKPNTGALLVNFALFDVERESDGEARSTAP